ncbi:MAG: diaminopimelate decarboxylase [Candidatus Omnitrophica bacterium]|nr:diaminopimelate decarboxylase [Candidatus Omnitrophota bacterium]MCM8825781.1 diaminopimelate decarboxylase [Candidatus Omnitrophota bacterium]
MEEYLELISDGLYKFRGGKLFIEGVCAEDICREFGTPVYVYSSSYIKRQIEKLRSAFKTACPLICYSMKANGNMSILNLIRKAGCGIDIVSAGELAKALRVGFSAEKIVFAGVGKTKQEIVDGLTANIFLFTVESVEELKTIQQIARQLKKIASVSLRINLDIDVDTHHYTKTSKKETKFGMPVEQVGSIIRSREKFSYIDVKGIHFHLGSNIKISGVYVQALERLKDFLKELNFMPSVIDIGGGFGIHYRKEHLEKIESFGKNICNCFLKNFSGSTMIIEPGRFIVGNSGILLTTVIYNKRTPHRNFLIVDSGMNDLIRPALYNSYHEIVPVKKKDCCTVYDIVGPVCETGDFLGKDRMLPADLKPGDFLAVMSAGAYGFSMSSNYNGRPRAAEVIVSGDTVKCCRRRETIQDLWKLEKTL